MPRSAWLVPALVALGLWASLLPQINYPSVASGEPDGDVLIAWPGWSVQQDLGSVGGTVGTFRIWVSADPQAELKDDVLTLWASLVDASTLEVVRQTSIDVRPQYIPTSRTLMFPGYVVPDGQRLLLQLQVAEHDKHYVIYQLTGSRPDLANLMLNGVSDAGSGPLAFTHIHTGSGLRAAVAGEPSARWRIGLALMFSLLAVIVNRRVLSVSHRSLSLARDFVQPRLKRIQYALTANPSHRGIYQATGIGRFLSAPVYPWMVSMAPILNYLASNPLHFAVSEAAIPLAMTLAVVSVLVVVLRVVFSDWHRPAAATSCLVVLFFSYGHIERVLDDRINEQLFFASFIIVAALAVVLVARARCRISRLTQFFNVASAVLLLLPLVSITAGMTTTLRPDSEVKHSSLDELASHVLPAGIPQVDGRKPDIYYIILDRYSRHDALGEFDNSDFIDKLRSRGFYVAMEATSNYWSSIHSIASSLNLSYLENLGHRTPVSKQEMISAINLSALAAILKKSGYTYVHLESGYIATEKAPLADTIVTFTRSGPIFRWGREASSSIQPGSPRLVASDRFVRHLVSTTALKPILGGRVSVGDEREQLDWWHPQRTLQMFDVLSRPMSYVGPKFVFAHIVKPHRPATFDQHCNQLVGQTYRDSLEDSHDPSVPSAFIGQLICINSLVLKTVDAILETSDRQAIIVIAGDHGRRRQGHEEEYEILAAFHLPHGGDSGLYPSISSVNHFRYILDYYFSLEIGLTDDFIVRHDRESFDVTAFQRGR